MVYRGPSRGCQRCRNRHLKCDEKRPACGKCTEKGYPCPGYTDIFDKAHRDETAKVVHRNLTGNRSNVCGFRMLPAAETRMLDHASSCSTAAGTRQRNMKQQQGPTLNQYIPPSMSQDPKADAVTLLFRRYSLNTDADATSSFMGLLPSMYAKSSSMSSYSPLTTATTALAILVFGIYTTYGYSGDTTLARTLYSNAVTRTREALRDPELSKSDDLLMTTLVLEEYENRNDIFRATTNRRDTRPQHVCGSIALLKHRGTLNYRDQLSSRLLTATRHSLLRHPWYCGIPLPTIETIRDICGHGIDDATTSLSARSEALIIEIAMLVDRLIDLGVRIRSRYSSPLGDNATQIGTAGAHPTGETGKTMGIQAILSRGIEIMGQCSHWYARVPWNWHPVTVPKASLHNSIFTAGVYELVSPITYANLEIANSVNRHRVTEMGALFLVHMCVFTTSSRDEQDTSLAQQQCLLDRVQVLVDEICASVPFFVGNVTETTANIDQVRFAHFSTPLEQADHVPTSSGRPQLMEYPDDGEEHARQIVASGLYMLYDILNNVIKYIQDSAEARDRLPAIRPGQMEWMQGQVMRLKAALQQRCIVAGC